MLLQSVNKEGLPGPILGAAVIPPERRNAAELAASTLAGQRKTGVSLLLTPVFRILGSSHPAFLREAEVGSIRRRPVGGGLGVYEPVPDRTVSGNDG